MTEIRHDEVCDYLDRVLGSHAHDSLLYGLAQYMLTTECTDDAVILAAKAGGYDQMDLETDLDPDKARAMLAELDFEC